MKITTKLEALLLILALTGCATIHRHPVAFGVVSGVAVAVTVSSLTRHVCPATINGYPYNGTPPCPNPATYDPGKHNH